MLTVGDMVGVGPHTAPIQKIRRTIPEMGRTRGIGLLVFADVVTEDLMND